jgi:hypothetical protein
LHIKLPSSGRRYFASNETEFVTSVVLEVVDGRDV